MPRPARAPLVLYTPAGLAEIARKGGVRATGRTVRNLVASGVIEPDVVVMGTRGRIVAFGFSEAKVAKLPGRKPGRPRIS